MGNGQAEARTETSWEVVRRHMTRDAKPGTIGWQVDLVKASDLFVRLLPQLKDSEAAFESWKAEPGLVEVLARREALMQLFGKGAHGVGEPGPGARSPAGQPSRG